MSRNRAYLPPKSTTNSSFMIDWEIVNRKKQIETLRPREIQVRKNHSFHAGSSDCNKSIFEKSFEDIYENQKNSQKFQKEFNQLKSLINSKQQQIEQSEKKRLSEHQNEIPKPLMQEIGNYHTFKPVFERLSSLIDVPKQNNQENIKIQTRLSTIFDSLEMESTRTSKDPQKVDSILQLVENLLKDCVIPILSQQKSSLSSQKSQPQIFTLQSSQQLNTNTITLRSMGSLFQDLIDLFKCTKESGYLKYQVQPKPVLIESVTQFNISKYQSCKLFDMYFEKEIQLDIAHKSFKQCVSTESCQIINQVLLIPIQYNNHRIIYVMNGFQDNIDYGFIQQNLQMQILRKSNSFIRLMSSINKCFQQRANLHKLQAINQLKFRVRRSNQITINLYHYFLKIGMKRIKQFQNKTDQKQQQNDRLFYILQNYNTKLQNQAFRAIQGNEDQLIMIQALQTENSVESYLRKVSMIIGEKIVLSILNEEIQIMTSYIPDVGLYQEYIDNVDDLSSYKSLNSITKPFNTELQNIGYEFTQRHIWQVTEDIYLITFSNMQSQYLSKLALVITNAMQFMRQKYLNVFSIVRNIHQQSYKRVLTKYFERWRTQQQEQIMNYEEDLQNLKLQNTIRTKYLSTALIQNIINRKQQTQKLQMVYMNEWRNQTKNEKNIQMRIRGGIYLMKRYIQSISKHNMIIAFREIAFSNFVNQSSPIVKNNTKRSIFTQREQSKRSQEELEQSVLWDVHQMRLNTPLHDQSYRTNKNPSPVTMNNSIQLTEYEINQYHSQRANQKQDNINIVRKNSRNKSNNSIDQENLPPPVGENRIYSKKTKDFVKKIQQTGHQRFNSTSPNMNVNKYNNTAFSFDENSEF